MLRQKIDEKDGDSRSIPFTILNRSFYKCLFILILIITKASDPIYTSDGDKSLERIDDLNFPTLTKNTFVTHWPSDDQLMIDEEIEKKITVGNNFLNERKEIYQYSISPTFLKYYNIEPEEIFTKIKKFLQTLFSLAHFKSILSKNFNVSLDPTGLLNKSNAITILEKEKRIFINIKFLLEQDPEIVTATLANELQHILVVIVNEQYYQEKFTKEKSKKYFRPYQYVSERDIYLKTIEKMLLLTLEKLDIHSYWRNSFAFANYYVQLLTYNLPLCEKLRKKSVEKNYISQNIFHYKNDYVTLFKLKLDDQIWELDSTLASLYVLLRPEHRKYLQPWVEYHEQYQQAAVLADKRIATYHP